MLPACVCVCDAATALGGNHTGLRDLYHIIFQKEEEVKCTFLDSLLPSLEPCSFCRIQDKVCSVVEVSIQLSLLGCYGLHKRQCQGDQTYYISPRCGS